MKKKVLMLLAVVVLAVGNAVAQTDSRMGSNEWRFNLSYDFGLKSGSKGLIGIKPEFGHYFADNVYLGIGTGVIGVDNFNSVSIPIFGHIEYDFSTSNNVVPYFSVQGGYDFNVSEGGGGAGEINPSIGIKFPIGKNTDMNLGLGYTRTIAKGGYGADYAGVKAGFIFDTAGRGLANFFKKADYSAEFEYYTSSMDYLEDEELPDNPTKYKYTLYGVRLDALFRVAKNFSIGPSIGIGKCNETEKRDYYEYVAWNGRTVSVYPVDEKYNGIYGSLMVRFRYDVRQISILNNLHPYACIDAGFPPIAEYLGNAFSIIPSVGVSYDLNNGGAFNLSIGYAKFHNDEWEDDITGNALRIALGYKF
jgi:hypothetical protein